MLRSLYLLLAAYLLSASAPPVLIGTNVPDENTRPPSATIAQMDWLIGTWHGTGIDDAPVQESWMRGSDDTLVGTFVQQTTDGGILFSEHMYIAEEAGSLVLKIKHFNEDMTGWEEKGDMLTLRLAAIDRCAARFGGVSFTCAAQDNPSLGLMITVKMQTGKDLLFRLLRTDVPVAPQCLNPWDLSEQELCYANVLGRAEEQMAQYLAAAIENQTWVANTIAERLYLAEPDPLGRPDLSVVEGIHASAAAFSVYRDAECESLLAKLKGAATPRSKALACSIKLTQERTFTIWYNWLAGTEVIPTILPEPPQLP